MNEINGFSRRHFLRFVIIAVAAVSFFLAVEGFSAETPAATAKTKLWIGTATADITPDLPVVMASLNVAKTIESRCLAGVLALESREGDKVVDQAIMVSCDLCILPGVQDGFRQHMAGRLPGFDINKLFLAATHTHTSMMVSKSPYDAQDYGDAMQPKDYLPFLYERMAAAVVKAWESRSEGAVAWGVGHAVVGHSRRVIFADGGGEMCLYESGPNFLHVDGYEDHSVDILCFYDEDKKLKATAITLSCPAQILGGQNIISADFWHVVRESLRKRYGQDLCILGFCAPGGEMCPHLADRNRRKSEERMDRLRGLTRVQELGRRVVDAFDDAVEVIAKDIRTDVPLVHLVRQVDLPARIVTEAEYAVAKKTCDDMDAKKDKGRVEYYWRGYWQLVVDRYLAQQKGERRFFPIEMHVIRLGDVAIATNPFELFVDYSTQIQAHSAAEQTILIQLAAYPTVYTGYVPTQRAFNAGGYSTEVQVNMIGPEGAQALVNRTLEEINTLWSK